MKPVAIFMFELSGMAALPFAQAGWECFCIDNAHAQSATIGHVHFVKADARHWMPTRDMVNRCRFFAAFPPCDDLAVSGALWFVGKGLPALAHAIDLFGVAARWAEFLEVPYFIENPRSTISTYWRKPDHTFNPSDFSRLEASEHFTKHTCLWSGGGFKMPPRQSLEHAPQENTILNMKGKGRDRANARSVTPVGFMRAVYAANFVHEAA